MRCFRAMRDRFWFSSQPGRSCQQPRQTACQPTKTPAAKMAARTGTCWASRWCARRSITQPPFREDRQASERRRRSGRRPAAPVRTTGFRPRSAFRGARSSNPPFPRCGNSWMVENLPGRVGNEEEGLGPNRGMGDCGSEDVRQAPAPSPRGVRQSEKEAVDLASGTNPVTVAGQRRTCTGFAIVPWLPGLRAASITCPFAEDECIE